MDFSSSVRNSLLIPIQLFGENSPNLCPWEPTRNTALIAPAVVALWVFGRPISRGGFDRAWARSYSWKGDNGSNLDREKEGVAFRTPCVTKRRNSAMVQLCYSWEIVSCLDSSSKFLRLNCSHFSNSWDACFDGFKAMWQPKIKKVMPMIRHSVVWVRSSSFAWNCTSLLAWFFQVLVFREDKIKYFSHFTTSCLGILWGQNTCDVISWISLQKAGKKGIVRSAGWVVAWAVSFWTCWWSE